jgi:hypothetical protein
LAEQIGIIGQILLIFQIVTFLSAGIALVAEDAPDTTKPQRWGRAYVNTLLLAAGVATLLNIAIRLV